MTFVNSMFWLTSVFNSIGNCNSQCFVNISVREAKMYEEVVGLRKGLLSSVLKSMEDKVRLAKTEEKLSEDVQTLQLEASAARASLQVRFSSPNYKQD